MTFRTSLDGVSKVMTPAVIAVLIWVAVRFFNDRSDENSFATPAVIALVVLLPGISYYLMPTAYRVGEGVLVIVRPFKNKVIPLDDISEVDMNPDLSGTIRVFGVGGVFGYTGIFYNRAVGRMTWYATRRNTLVLVRLKNGKRIVLSPDEPEQFTARFRSV